MSSEMKDKKCNLLITKCRPSSLFKMTLICNSLTFHLIYRGETSCCLQRLQMLLMGYFRMKASLPKRICVRSCIHGRSLLYLIGRFASPRFRFRAIWDFTSGTRRKGRGRAHRSKAIYINPVPPLTGIKQERGQTSLLSTPFQTCLPRQANASEEQQAPKISAPQAAKPMDSSEGSIYWPDRAAPTAEEGLGSS